jgi:SAM-dependent methyltransferase
VKAVAAAMPAMAKPVRRYRNALVRSRIEKILAARGPIETKRAEGDFEALQRKYHGVPDYGFDAHSKWRRGMERALQLTALLPDPNRPQAALEVGCGDAMTGFLFSLDGHQVSLSDMADWRDARAKSLPFYPCTLEDGLPLKDSTFDFAFSYNSFEHFRDPGRCFQELKRVLKPSGLLHLSFGPLYASPWGLHAYSALMMPFPQFLFSPEFIRQKLKDIGVYDLGKNSVDLQPLNAWTVAQFCGLWSGADWRVIHSDLWAPDYFPELVLAYPEAFRGRGLSLADISVQSITVTLQLLAKSK